MSKKLIPTILILHSKELEERLIDEAEAAGLSKSALARRAVDLGFARVLQLSRRQIMEMTQTPHGIKVIDLPRLGAHLTYQTDNLLRSVADGLRIPLWRVYSLSIEFGLDALPEIARAAE